MAGKYRLLERLGEGGVADVYEAVYDQIGQRVAVKILKRDFLRSTDVASRFLTEARAASAVGHPGIVQVFDYGHLPTGEPYLVMELLKGEDLYAVLQRVKRFEIEHAVGTLLHVLDALEAAHQAGVVHRDMKPENVIITRGPGGEPWAKIIDFGIARVTSAGAGSIRNTAVGTLVGTPHYLSPEQARGQQDIDARTDVYAVGVMLFELLTGRLPYEGGSAQEVAERVANDPFPSPRKFNPSLPVELEQVMLKATARRREDRYASAREFIDALRPFKGESVTVHVLADGEADDANEISSVRRVRDLAAAPLPSMRSKPVGGSAPPPPPPPRSSTPTPRLSPAISSPRPEVTTPLPASISSTRPPPPHLRSPGADAAPDEGLRSAARSRKPPRLWLWSLITATVIGVATLVAVLLGRSSEPTTSATGPSDVAVEPPDVGLLVAQVAADADADTAWASDTATARDATTNALSDADAMQGPDAAEDGEEKDEASAPRTQVLVKLEGLLPGTRALVDGQAVGEVFPMEVSDESHTLRVVGRGWKPFVHEFLVRGELTIPVQLERSESAGPATPVPQSDAGSTPPEDRDAGRQRLGNPFGGV
jgi:serine/threonine protein kinase